MMIKKYASLAGIKKRVYPHLFRASSITHMAEAGATIPEIMAQSKHRSVDTLIKHYIRPSEKHNKEVYLKTLSFNKKPERKSDILEPEKPPQEEKPADTTLIMIIIGICIIAVIGYMIYSQMKYRRR